MARLAHALLTALLAAAPAAADPLGDALDGRCRPDGRLLPAARALLGPELPTPRALRLRTEAAGLYAPTVEHAVLPSPSPDDLRAALDALRSPRFVARCAIATDGVRVALAVAPRAAEWLIEESPDGLAVRAALPEGTTDATVLATRADGSVEATPLDADGWARLTSPTTLRTLQVLGTLAEGPVPLATWHRTPGDDVVEALNDARGVIAAMNRARAATGVPALRREPLLDGVAQSHADDLARRGVLAHRPDAGDGPSERLAAAGLRADRIAENLARADSLGEAVARWLDSPSHRANVVDRTLLGVGVGVAARGSELYVVALFAAGAAMGAVR